MFFAKTFIGINIKTKTGSRAVDRIPTREKLLSADLKFVLQQAAAFCNAKSYHSFCFSFGLELVFCIRKQKCRILQKTLRQRKNVRFHNN